MPSPRATTTLLLLPALGLAAAFDTCAAPATYVLDPVHTRVVLAVDHAGFSKALGAVSGSTGTLRFDPEDWASAQVEVTVPLDRLDFGDPDWNRATLGRNLLQAQRHPQARFVSTRVEAQGADRAWVYGDLTLRGVTREVRLDVVFNRLERHPMPPYRRTAGFSAQATLRRSDFGISAWKTLIGDEVELRIEAEATRSGAGEREATGTEHRQDGHDEGKRP